MNLLSTLYYIYFFVTAAIAVSLTTLLIPVFALLDPDRRILHYITCLWTYHYVLINPGWRVKWEGRQHLAKGNCVFVANHQSVFDVFVLHGILQPYKWVAKEWIFKVPFVGWHMRLGRHVYINPASTERTIRDCESWLKKGISLMMFPEGTRSEDGNIKAFKDGAFKFATDVQVPVVPILINGTRSVLPKHSRQIDFSEDIEIRILPPIHPEEFDGDTRRLRDHVRQLMMDTLMEMRKGEAKAVS